MKFPQDETGRLRKLSRPWHGPYRVVDVTELDVTVVKVYHLKHGEIRVHQSRLCKFPENFPAGYYWYGGKQKGPGRPPRWVETFISVQDSHSDVTTPVEEQTEQDTGDEIIEAIILAEKIPVSALSEDFSVYSGENRSAESLELSDSEEPTTQQDNDSTSGTHPPESIPTLPASAEKLSSFANVEQSHVIASQASEINKKTADHRGERADPTIEVYCEGQGENNSELGRISKSRQEKNHTTGQT